MGLIVTLLQIAGLVLITIGAFLLWPWLGFMTAGVACVLLGIALER